ncbi:hypothetical protein DXV76_03575 [Rhodobacteraceae bacterium CCMM004]|nr:hypothetical protein DXV76_03575 [Rhodobacteraceae bacterium CCMM004]
MASKYRAIGHGKQHAIDGYNEFFSSEGGAWYDVSTISDVLEGRYDEIAPSEPKSSALHEIAIIDAPIDMINFIIIEHPEQRAEVFFGWIFSESERLTVYHTRSPIIVGLFQDYFRLLLARSKERIRVDYSSPERNIVAAKSRLMIGTWVVIPKLSSVKAPQDFLSYAILKIAATEYDWQVSIDVYSVERSVRTRVISGDRVIAYGDSVFYEGLSKDVDGMSAIDTEIGYFRAIDGRNDMLSGLYVSKSKRRVIKNYAARLTEKTDFSKQYSFEEVKACISGIIEIKEIFGSQDESDDRHLQYDDAVIEEEVLAAIEESGINDPKDAWIVVRMLRRNYPSRKGAQHLNDLVQRALADKQRRQ